MRVTTNMVMRNYASNLSSTLSSLESSRKQVESGARFSQSYEDPLAAARASVLDTRYARNSDYLNAVDETQKWQDTQEDVLGQINKIVTLIDEDYSTSAMSAPAGESGRKGYAASLRQMQESMVFALNTKYGDSYVMAGADASNAPFSMDADGKLLYRGKDVNDSAVMDQLAKETAYVDMGFGLTFDNGGQIVSSSAFDSAYPGIKLVGYGETADGTSKNLINLTGEMAKILENEPFDSEAYGKLWTQFHKGTTSVQDQMATIGTKSQLLESTKDRLETEKLSITEQYDSTVNIDPAEAIMNYSWSQYVYNVALKIGTSVISPSLLDFMK